MSSVKDLTKVNELLHKKVREYITEEGAFSRRSTEDGYNVNAQCGGTGVCMIYVKPSGDRMPYVDGEAEINHTGRHIVFSMSRVSRSGEVNMTAIQERWLTQHGWTRQGQTWSKDM